jgi:putative membrane protein
MDTQRRKTMNRTFVLLGMSALFAASAGAQARTTGSGIPISKDVPAPTTTSSTTTLSPGEVSLTTAFNLAAYANMNEKNIAAHMAAGDSLEIRLAELALSKATSQAVRDYASMLLNAHRAHLAEVMEIITDEGVGAEPMANDPEGMRMRQMLSRLQTMAAGTSWDAAFVRFQVQHHQNEIDLLTPNIKNVHDDDFEDLFEESLKSLAAHRDQGRTVATSLGISL